MPSKSTSKESRLLRVACILFLYLMLTGCRVVILSGPSFVALGDTAVFTLDVASVESTTLGLIPSLWVDVPVGWTPISSTFTGTVGGVPVSGTGEVLDSNENSCGSVLGVLPSGFQRLAFVSSEPIAESSTEDRATVTLEFAVGQQPSGAFDVKFAFVGGGSCSSPAIQTINPPNPLFRVSEVVQDLGVGPSELFNWPTALLLSPEEDQAYVNFRGSSSIVAMDRDPITGDLTYLESHVDGEDGVTGLNAVNTIFSSPDGRDLYGISIFDFVISHFSRDLQTGTLTFIDSIPIDFLPSDTFGSIVAFSPDGLHLSVAKGFNNGIATFSRNPMTGDLTSVQDLSPPNLDGAGSLTYSPDGLHLYATARGADSSIQVYSRDPMTGLLTFIQEYFASDGLSAIQSISSLAVDPDGTRVYVTARADIDGSLVVFSRDTSTGLLSFSEAHFDGIDGVTGLQSPRTVAVGASGVVITSGSPSTAIFRPSGGGTLAFQESHQIGTNAMVSPKISLDGRNAYMVSPVFEHGVIVIMNLVTDVFSDGFETGDTSSWVAVP